MRQQEEGGEGEAEEEAHLRRAHCAEGGSQPRLRGVAGGLRDGPGQGGPDPEGQGHGRPQMRDSAISTEFPAGSRR